MSVVEIQKQPWTRTRKRIAFSIAFDKSGPVTRIWFCFWPFPYISFGWGKRGDGSNVEC